MFLNLNQFSPKLWYVDIRHTEEVEIAQAHIVEWELCQIAVGTIINGENPIKMTARSATLLTVN